MKDHGFIREVRRIYNRLARRLPMSPARCSGNGVRVSRRISFGQPESVAYQLIGEKTEGIAPIFRGLDINLQRSGMKINFRAYVSLAVLASLIASFASLAFIPCVLVFSFGVSPWSSFLLGVGASLLTSALSIIVFYIYPIYRADRHGRELDDELPFTTGYMSILTSAGVQPEKVFYSLASLEAPMAVSTEAKHVVTNISLFGLDVISALEKISKITPSERLRETLEGLISTIHSGSSSTTYLRDKTSQFMKLKRISLRKFSDTLSLLSEFYVALLLTGPLLLIIMLSVMAMLNQGDLGLLRPDLLLNLITYLGLPVGSIIFLIILDALTPKC
jgi:flagellar protein FlaJ